MRTLAALLSGILLATFLSASPAAAAPSKLPMTVANSSGSGAKLYVHLVGHMGESDTPGYLTAGGTFKKFPAATSTTPKNTVSVAITGPKDGKTKTLKIPKGFSGRIYYSFSKKLVFQTVKRGDGSTGLVQPVPWKSGSANQRTLRYDWVEVTYDAGGLWWNTTQVDQFALPARLSVTDSKGTRSTGTFTSTVKAAAAKLAKVPGFGKVVQKYGDARRIINPSHLFESGRFSKTYLAGYIDRVWTKYSTSTLYVRPFLNDPEVVFTGSVVGGKFEFRNDKGAIVSTFDKPSTQDVFECNGALSSPNDQTTGPISRSLCADLNRGVLGTQKYSPSVKTSTYYKTNSMNRGRYNHFSAVMHSVFSNKRAYGFSFDDVNGQDTLLNAGNPKKIKLTVLSPK